MAQVDEQSTVPLLDADERAELERLRAELAALRAGGGPPAEKPPTPGRWRSVVAIVLIVLGCVLAPVALVAVWTNRTISDTDRFVETVSPLVRDPDVQNRIVDRVTTAVMDNIDVKAIGDDAVDALATAGLPAIVTDRLKQLTPTLQSAVEGFVRDRVHDLVTSSAFASAFDQTVRTTQRIAIRVLDGDSTAVQVRGGKVYLDLAPFIDLAKQRLADRGLTLVERIPELHPTIAIADDTQLVRAQGAYKVLHSAAAWLPWIMLLLLATGIFLARRKLRALVGAGLGIALAMLVLAVGLFVARSILIGAVPTGGASAAGAAFDIIVHFLRIGLRTVAVVGLVVALGAFLAGPSPTAVGLRRWWTRQMARIRVGPSTSGPVATWTRRYVRLLRFGALGLAVLVFLFLAHPTGVAVLVIAICLLVVLAVIEYLARPAQPVAPEIPTQAPPAATG
ncbi:hypothetical protein [Petropleomorpha daqingensis]|uniref:Integral membrane protein n=1 Tax=Petropleomorpha daqingensis TaxID=2026353 RepID=A0A853C909_9ACTN|nr:hypothetical protein [Petropleomorpha daqingensis]NYJ04460.1 hypothetical protein [Petropleomorpha daqingensis]